MADIELPSPELQMLINNKTEGYNYRQPREEPWREIYELYNDHVTVNRLTQRQSVNMPLMKTVLRTLMKNIDEMPIVEFQNNDNDLEAEVFENEYWKLTLEYNNAELQDIVDKKQDFFAGRTFDSWQIKDGRVVFNIEDFEDILVSRFMNPYDLNSSRYLIHTHIFVPLTSLAKNPDYDVAEINKLIKFFETKLGILKAQDNMNSLQQKNKKLSNLGVTDIDDPILGETYVELTLHHVYRDNDTYEGQLMETQIFTYVEAENQCILMKKPLEKILGVTVDNWWRNHYNYHSWGDDLDKQNFWTGGIGDIVLTPNKVQNVWFSQKVENRTMRGFGMTFYDATKKADGFVPNTFQPRPFGFYGVPGKPSDVIQRVDLPDLSDSIDDMNFITEMVQNATGATPGQQGITPPAGTPLGTTQIVEGEAKARTQGIAKFYTDAWKKRAQTFLKLIEGSPDKIDAVKIFKKGRNTDEVHRREIAPKDWMTKSGYTIKVWSQDDKDKQDSQSLQKLQALMLAMPDNPKVKEIYDRKLAEYASLKPDEVAAIMDYEKQKLTMPQPVVDNGAGGQATGGAPNGVLPTTVPTPTLQR